MSTSDFPIPTGYCQCGCGQETKIAKRSRYDLGHAKGEPLKYVNGHNPVKHTPLYLADEKTGCWVWQRACNGRGYGQHWHPELKCNIGAHRYMYEQRNGPIPEHFQVHHKCGNPSCVNPDHLEALESVTHVRKGGPTKLNENIVAEIRGLWSTGTYTQKDLAAKFDIGQMTVSDIVTGVTWSDHPRERKLR